MSVRMQLSDVATSEPANCSGTQGRKEKTGGEDMRKHILVVPQDVIFDRSPRVRVQTDDTELSSYIRLVVDECSNKPPRAGQAWQPFTRKASGVQRDGHLCRLQGMQIFEKILRWAQQSSATEYEVGMYGQVRSI